MSSIASNLAGLTPKQRALLEKLLKKQGLDISQLPIAPQPRDRTVFPLSFSQQRMWFLHQLAPEDAAYNCSVALRLTGKLSVTALQKTIQHLVGRHEALRTTFVTIDGHPFQVIAPEQDIALCYLDVSGLPALEQTARVCSLTTEEVKHPFDLAQGPLLRILLAWLGQDDYVLQVTMHHIISDGWSLGIMVREMLELYKAYEGGQAVTLAMPPIQYADYAVWQREWFQGERLASQLAYWKEQLANAPTLLSLQTDRPRAAVQSNQGAALPFTLSKELSEALKELARSEGATMFMALLAAFDVLLFRYTGQQDMLIGTPIANRNRAETANVIGCFINTLVLRSELSHEMSFRQLLSHVRETTLNAYANQDVPFEQLIEAVKVKRNAGYPPLVQVFFVLQNVTMDALELSDMLVEPFQLDKGTAQFDLTLEMAEEAGGLNGHIEYNTGLFDASTIERLVGCWQTLLEGIVKQPDLALASLPMLPEEEYQRIVYEWNATRRVYPESQQCLHTLIEKQVERTPDAIAVVFAGQRLTYRELDSQAERLAQYLIRAGVGPEVPVGVCMERSVEMVVALLGILKAGGAYVPLDPEYPGERLAYICQETQVPIILTHTRLRALLSELHTRLLCIEELEAWPPLQKARRWQRVTSDNLAYIIYTSGSTGKPKGAMNTHRGIVNRLLWMQEAYQLTASDRVLQKTPYSFDVSVWEFFWPLITGATVVMARPGGHRDVHYLVECITEHAITTLHFVPSMLSIFLEGVRPGQCSSIRRVICSGEALAIGHQQRFFATFYRRALLAGEGSQRGADDAALFNLYGPTEAAVDVTEWTCSRAEGAFSVPIGRPIANIQMHVLDAWYQPVPVGVPGELYISGIGLGRGYLKRADLTAERFVPDPYSLEPGARMYRTGDLACYRADGALEYLGRTDFQVKLHGQRIELGEIEAVLQEHPGIQEAVVLLQERSPGNLEDRQLVAYMVPDQRLAWPIRRLLQLDKSEFASIPRHDLPNGMTIVGQNRGEIDFLYREIFEERAYLKHGITVHQGDCIFDVGAHIGLFSLFVTQLCPPLAPLRLPLPADNARQQCPNVQVYAFEPMPATCAALRCNMHLYDLPVRVLAYGLSNETTTTPFTYYPRISILSGRFADEAQERAVVRSFVQYEYASQQREQEVADSMIDDLLAERLVGEQITCQVKTLSEAMRECQVERIDLLKVDVEKSELDVLAGIEEQDWGKIRQIVLETSTIDGRLGQVVDILERRGYAVVVERDSLLKESGLHNIYARRGEPERQSEYQDGLEQTSNTWNSEQRLIEDVRATLSKRVPGYMVPSAFILLESLPLTANGKLDRRALPLAETRRTGAERPFTAPHTPLEQMLADIWQQVLNLPQISIHDDFFEAGGNSLLAIQLVVRIQDRSGLSIPLSIVFQAPTVEAMAGFLAQQSQQKEVAEWSPLVAIQPHGSRSPFFCIHPAPGNVFCYRDLAGALGPHQPFYALQARGVDGQLTPLSSIEEMAAAYIQAIRTVQPEGPYLLGGHSLGGCIAFEMAQQLHEQGAEVALLAILDTPAPAPKKSRQSLLSGEREEMAWLLADGTAILAQFSGKDIALSYEMLQALEPAAQLAYVRSHLHAHGLLAGGDDMGPIQGFLQVQKASIQALDTYTPRVYRRGAPGGMVALFCTEEMLQAGAGKGQAGQFSDESPGWNSLMPQGIHVYKVPGDHISMLTPPHIQVVAERLRHCLDCVQEYRQR